MSRPTYKKSKPAPSDWEKVEQPIIHDLVRNEKWQTRREALKRITVTSLGAFSVIAGLTLWRASRQPTLEELREGMIIPISCKQVMGQLAYYHQGVLEDGMTRRVHHHLKMCDHCRKMYEQTYDIQFA